MKVLKFNSKISIPGTKFRKLSIDRTRMWKSSAQRLLLTCLAIYTCLYLIAVNSVYFANRGYETSINIRVRQVNAKIRERNHTFYKTAKHDSKRYMAVPELRNRSHDRLNDKNDEFMHAIDNEGADADKPEMKGKRKNPFTYDHPVLRRIEGIAVFYISAIAEMVNMKTFSTTPVNSILDNTHKTSISNIFLRPLKQSNDSVGFGSITINGWEYYSHAKTRYCCCLRYDKNVTSYDVIRKLESKNGKTKKKHKGGQPNEFPDHQKDSLLMVAKPLSWKNIWNIHKFKIIKAGQFTCPLVPVERNANEIQYPTKVALSNKKECTNRKALKFIDIDRQVVIKGDSIALCPKLVYGNYSAERLIEWFEFNKLMGVDKIMLFTYNIVKEVKNVLNHYVKEGLLITKEFDLPAKTTFKRKPGDKHMMAFQDEQVTVFDCIERFYNFRFVAVLDLDEFLIPTNRNATWRTMLKDLLSEHQNASGFTFHTQIFTLNWGISNPKGKLFVTKYTRRTSTMWDRKKNVIIPERIQRGKVWTHAFASKSGYEPVKIPTKIANIFHYRKCRRHWIASNTCTKKRHKYYDDTMVFVMQRIERQILKLKNKLLFL